MKQISIKRILRMLSIVILAVTVIAFWVFFYLFLKIFFFPDNTASNDAYGGQDLGLFTAAGCNVAGIDLHGELGTFLDASSTGASSEDIVFGIKAAEDADNIKAILIDIDSPGGYVVAAEEVANALKQSAKPTVALIRESGDSAAYWAATGADIIFASALSDVGSIGITGSYVQNVRYNQKEGYDFVNLSTGKYKDMWNPDTVLTDEEKALIMRDLQKLHQTFVNTVAENRNLPVAAVSALADGSSMLGDAALANHLIDRIGSYAEVEQYLKEKLGEKPTICW